MVMEGLCRAYVQAIAARVGMLSSKPDPDFGIDLCLRAVQQDGTQYTDSGLQLDLQLRSTTRASITGDEIRYDLDVRTYNLLRQSGMCPRILVVLVLPEDETQWLSQSPDEFVLRHCAYWFSLEGAAATSAAYSVRIGIPHSQIFSVQAVQDLLRNWQLRGATT